MVHDQLRYLKHYLTDEIYVTVQEFLEKVSEEIPEGDYVLKGNEVFAKVMSYPTHREETCQIESHRKYIDIQATISGAEGISAFRIDDLQTKTKYDEDADVLFYENGAVEPYMKCVNIPGYFTILYPWEAHRPQECVVKEEVVKKFVIKIRMKE